MKRIGAIYQNLIDTFSPEHSPIGVVDCMEKIEVCTPESTITSEMISDINAGMFHPSRILRITGPIYINEVMAGETIIINIHSIQLIGKGRSWFGPWIGLLKNDVLNAYLQEFNITDNFILSHNGLRMKATPMIGTLGVTPRKAVSCLQPGDYGGNMDIPTLSTGSKLYLKSQVNGGLLAIGDVHAAMGYGEVLGTGIEIGSITTISIEKFTREIPINIPIHETLDSYEIIKSHESLELAMKDAVMSAIKFVEYINMCDFNEAYVIIGEFCNLVVTQVVNPTCSVLVRIPKMVLKSKLGG